MKLGDIASALQANLQGDPSLEVCRLSPLDHAQPGDLTFILDAKHIAKAQQSQAIAFVTFKLIEGLTHQLVVSDHKRALAQTISLFFPNFHSFDPPSEISEKADIHPTAQLAAGVKVGPFAVIGEASIIGENTIISSHAIVGSGCKIGKESRLHPHSVLYNGVSLGDRVIIHSGAVLGRDGFGYYLDQGKWTHIDQIGTVEIGNDVEIGANTSIDRGCLGATIIESGCKIDNLVQIAHNCKIGHDSLITSQVGMVGSATIGHHVVIGGQAGINGVNVGSQTQIAAKSGVTKDILPGSIVSGYPAWDHQQELKKEAFIRTLSKNPRKRKPS